MWKKRRLALQDPFGFICEEEFFAPGLCSTGGGGGGRSAPATSTQTVQQELAPEQRQLLNLVLPTATSFVNQPPTLFPGSTVVGPSQLESEAQQFAVDIARNQLPQLQQGAFNAQQFLQSGQAGSPANNPALSANISTAIRPIIEGLTEQVLPAVRGQAGLAGQPGSTRQGIAEGIASKGAFNAAGATAADIANQAFQESLKAQTFALGLAPQTSNLAFAAPNILSAVGSQQRAFEQARLTEEANKFLQEQILPFLAAQQVAGLAFGIPGGSATATSLQPQPGTSIGSQILGGASTALGLAGLFAGLFGGGAGGGLGAATGSLLGVLSDRRFKRDIEPVGQLNNGLTVYAYRFREDGPIQIGVMADEVAAVKPEAINVISGVSFVDYAQAVQ